MSKNSLVRDEVIARSDAINAQIDLVSKQIELGETKEILDIKEEMGLASNNISDLIGNIEDAGLELGWTVKKYNNLFHNEGYKSAAGAWVASVCKFIGLCIAGLLISFGAPFWHDFVGTFTGLRKTLTGEKGGNGGGTTTQTGIEENQVNKQ